MSAAQRLCVCLADAGTSTSRALQRAGARDSPSYLSVFPPTDALPAARGALCPLLVLHQLRGPEHGSHDGVVALIRLERDLLQTLELQVLELGHLTHEHGLGRRR